MSLRLIWLWKSFSGLATPSLRCSRACAQEQTGTGSGYSSQVGGGCCRLNYRQTYLVGGHSLHMLIVMLLHRILMPCLHHPSAAHGTICMPRDAVRLFGRLFTERLVVLPFRLFTELRERRCSSSECLQLRKERVPPVQVI